MTYSFKSHAETGEHHVAGETDHNDEGRVTGGYAVGPFVETFPLNGLLSEKAGAPQPVFAIRWQDGPVDREAGEAPNGAFVEDVIEVCARRLEAYAKGDQETELPTMERLNEMASDALREALGYLKKRRELRRARGVEGTYEK